MGYSSALSTHPGILEKSVRGGEKMSTSWFITALDPAEVWMAGGGITASDGAGQTSWSSARQSARLAVQGHRM
jgi:hypothetical protein